MVIEFSTKDGHEVVVSLDKISHLYKSPMSAMVVVGESPYVVTEKVWVAIRGIMREKANADADAITRENSRVR